MSPLPRFEIRKGRPRLGRRRFYVVHIAANGEVLNASEQLNDKATALANIASVKANADAPIVDLT